MLYYIPLLKSSSLQKSSPTNCKTLSQLVACKTNKTTEMSFWADDSIKKRIKVCYNPA